MISSDIGSLPLFVNSENVSPAAGSRFFGRVGSVGQDTGQVVGGQERPVLAVAKDLADDLPLFAATPKPAARKTSGPSEIEKALQELNPDELTPKQALEALYELKAALVKEPQAD